MTKKIDSKITGFKVKTDEKSVLNSNLNSNLVLNSLLEREEVLFGRTIKIKPPLSENAYYITVNFQETKGVKQPFEVFIRTKDIDNQELILTQAITYSSIFRKGGDYQFIIDEMKLIHDPKGSYRGKLNGERFTFLSLTSHISYAIEKLIEQTLENGTVN